MAGIFDTRGKRSVDPSLLQQMNEALFHRGPDGDGKHIGPGIGLTHRRLAIIDLVSGTQPMYNEDRSVVIVYNGEIYNYKDLRSQLRELGHVFKTESDTEVIVHGWQEWGPDCVKRFRGMFAFALWDDREQRLFLARDRLGKKPLYYTCLPNGLMIFGSELKALLCHPELSRELDVLALEEYFAYGYVPDPRSIFKNVLKLEPGHYLSWRRGGASELRAYWELRISEDKSGSVEEIRDELRTRFREAVQMRLVSDVPIGAFLSGGVDSSGIVAQMAQLSSKPVNTFTASFDHKGFDESKYAGELAERYQTNHRVSDIDPSSFDLVDVLAGIYDEPFADSSAMPTFKICAAARQHVTVALSGDGGDEMFAGYRRYRWHQREEQMRSLLPNEPRRLLFGLLGRLYPKLDWAPQFLRAKTTFQELALDSVGGYFNNVCVMNDSLRSSIYSPSFKSELQGYSAKEVLRRHMLAANTDHPLLQAQYADIKTYLPGDILVKVDRASMANSLEVRAPILDHDFVEWSASLPAKLKLNGGESKLIFKQALEPSVPHHLLYRSKQGFSVPLSSWFRGPLKQKVRESITGDALAQTGYFDMKTLTGLVDQHQSGIRDHGQVLWSLLMFASFLRHTMGSTARQEVA